MIGDIVQGRVFSGVTNPTKTQVENELDNIAGEMNSWLSAHGYETIVDSTEYPDAHAYCEAANDCGAAAVLLSSVPPMVFDPNADGSQNRASMLQKRFDAWKKAVEKDKLKAGRDTDVLGNFYAGASEDSDGNTKAALMTRDMDWRDDSKGRFTE